jgi:ABC-2 type transport system ATP-binding protein
MQTSSGTMERPGAATSPGGEVVVEIDALTKRYGPRTVVDRLSMRVRRGEVFGFLGPNGAGKTTTLRMLMGLVRPTSGSASVLGRPAGARGSNVGALIEGPGFYPYLSGRENLRLLAAYAGVGRDRIGEVLRTVDLTDRAEDRYGTYSLGMKQRLGVAAALLRDPQVVLLDEPTNGLDPAGITDMRAVLRRLGTEGRTVVLSSHLLGEVEQVCDRVAVVSQGRLVVESTVGELLGLGRVLVEARPLSRAAEVAAALLGSDRVTVVDGALHLQVRPDDIGSVNRALVLADVEVTGLRRVARTLEEAFLQITRSSPAEDQSPVEPQRGRVRRAARRRGVR